MGLFVLGVILLLFGFILLGLGRQWFKEGEQEAGGMARIIGWGLTIGAVVCLIFSLTVKIETGHVGVPVVFGRVLDYTYDSGLHLKAPWVTVVQMSVRKQEYTMSVAPQEGEVQGNDAIDALSSDGLKITMDITVRYRLNETKAAWVYREIGTGEAYKRVIVRPKARTAIRNVASRYTAAEIYGVKRPEVQQAIFEEIKEDFEQNGLICEAVLLRNVILPETVQAAIEQKVAAQEAIQRAQYEVERARMEAEKRRVEAEGIAAAQRIIQETLTEEYLQWKFIEAVRELVGSPNTTFLIVPYDSGLMPQLMLPQGVLEPGR